MARYFIHTPELVVQSAALRSSWLSVWSSIRSGIGDIASHVHEWRGVRGPVVKMWNATLGRVSRSTAEAKAHAVVQAGREGLGARQLLHDLGWGRVSVESRSDASAACSAIVRQGVGVRRHVADVLMHFVIAPMFAQASAPHPRTSVCCSARAGLGWTSGRGEVLDGSHTSPAMPPAVYRLITRLVSAVQRSIAQRSGLFADGLPLSCSQAIGQIIWWVISRVCCFGSMRTPVSGSWESAADVMRLIFGRSGVFGHGFNQTCIARRPAFAQLKQAIISRSARLPHHHANTHSQHTA